MGDGYIYASARPAVRCYAAIPHNINMPVGIMRKRGILSLVRQSWESNGCGALSIAKARIISQALIE
jgi:hypothetical protein